MKATFQTFGWVLCLVKGQRQGTTGALASCRYCRSKCLSQQPFSDSSLKNVPPHSESIITYTIYRSFD